MNWLLLVAAALGAVGALALHRYWDVRKVPRETMPIVDGPRADAENREGVVCPRCKSPGGDVVRLAEIRTPFTIGDVVRDEVLGYRYACQRCPCIFNATGAGTWDVCAESYPYTPERSRPAARDGEAVPPPVPRAQPPRPRSAPNV